MKWQSWTLTFLIFGLGPSLLSNDRQAVEPKPELPTADELMAVRKQLSGIAHRLAHEAARLTKPVQGEKFFLASDKRSCIVLRPDGTRRPTFLDLQLSSDGKLHVDVSYQPVVKTFRVDRGEVWIANASKQPHSIQELIARLRTMSICYRADGNAGAWRVDVGHTSPLAFGSVKVKKEKR